MLNKNHSGNELFTITLTDLWVFLNEILISAVKFLERLYSLVTEVDQPGTCGDI